MKHAAPLLKIDASRQEVFVKGKRVAVSPTQYRIMVALRASNKTLSREQIIETIQSENPNESIYKKSLRDGKFYQRTVDQHIARLRRAVKLPIIETVTTFGYKWIEPTGR